MGASSRRIIGDTVFGLVRWRGLLDGCGGAPFSWERRLDVFLEGGYRQEVALPPHIRCSFPRWLFERLGSELCLACNEEAPLAVRANTIKTTRDALLERWEGVTRPTEQAPHGILFERRMPLFSWAEHKEGLFEVQDEASQLVSEQVAARPGEQVLDFCAGSGGKALALAPAMQGRGQLYLHDVRTRPLQQAALRLRRAGVQNAQVGRLPALTSCDWVLVDAPCSGTGTLRRNVDAKWRLKEADIETFVALQRAIFAKALGFKKRSGCIVYATCSLLPEENESQVSFFCNEYSLQLQGKPFQSRPSQGGMDGFFAAVMK